MRVRGCEGALLLLDWGRKGSRFDLGLKSFGPVGAVAEWLIFTESAAAERNRGPARKIKLVSILIKQLKIAFYPNTSVAPYRDLRWHFTFSSSNC